MVVVLPTPLIDRWMQARRGIEKLDVNLPSPRWQVPPEEMNRRAGALSGLLQRLTNQPNGELEAGLSQVEARIFDAILDMIPSAEVIEPLHSRARIAREVLNLLHGRLDNPPTITETVRGRRRARADAVFELRGSLRPAASSIAGRTASERDPTRFIAAREADQRYRGRRTIWFHPFRTLRSHLSASVRRVAFGDLCPGARRLMRDFCVERRDGKGR